MILEYILKYHLQDCVQILSEEDNLGYFNIKIDFLKLFETYPDVGDSVLCSPIESLPACCKDILKAQQNLLEQDEYKQQIEKLSYKSLKRNVQARFFGLPVCPELHRTVFPKNVDLGCFLKVTGTVVRVTQAKMLEYQRKYVCIKCKYENEVVADFENRYILKTPSKCANDETRCKSSNFTQVHLVSREHCKDYQEIKIQELANKLSIGSIPGSMWVVLENDLVDNCKPGDDVNICGTVRRRWRPTAQNKKAEVELVLQANSVDVCNSQRSEVVSGAPDVKECFAEFWSKFEACPLKGQDQILAAVCPQVYGLHLVKLAVLLTVITGSNHIIESEIQKRPSQDDNHTTRVRGQCHLLLVGDPGTGKSQLLRAGAQLTARSVCTSGAGSTRAGLTCAALREEGEWQLEAGALVLSDGGVCCIDEISQLREHDRTAIHEAMEQQTISIAKAGIVCKLNTRCAVIAACNPKGHYETDQPLSVNVSLGTPLLSRFDLIFILLDTKNKAWDKLVTSYILFGGSNSGSKNEWSLEKLQMYISLVGPKPASMTKSANTILQSYYMMQRKSEYRDPSRTTVRMLDSLVRLSQAHCRLMYRTTIIPMDAVIAVSLVDLSMQDCTLSDTADALHSTFQKYPDFEYLCTAKKLLTRLNLSEIWKNELLYYGKLLQTDHRTLENDINRRNYQLFAKFNDVTDDNIHLSASLVTSSYFNNKKPEKDDDLNEFRDKENLNKDYNLEDAGVSEKLAATLKKHAMMNKKEKKIPNIHKKNNTNKRKHKEVTIDVKLVKGENSKRTKRPKGKETTQVSSDSGDENINAQILDAVPSVNDIFSDLGMDFKFESSASSTTSDTRKDKNDQGLETINKKSKNESSSLENQNENTEKNTNQTKSKKSNEINRKIKIEKETPRKAIDKLKQFQFTEKHDLSKFYEEKADKNLAQHVVKLEVISKGGSNSATKPKTSDSTSQISIFETSDCDIVCEDTENLQKNQEKVVVNLGDTSKSSSKVKSISNSQISIFESSDCDIDLDI